MTATLNGVTKKKAGPSPQEQLPRSWCGTGDPVQAGWVALLLACVEYDIGSRQAADTIRQAALSLGVEADHAEIQG